MRLWYWNGICCIHCTGEPYLFASFIFCREIAKAPPIYYFIELCKAFRTTPSRCFHSDELFDYRVNSFSAEWLTRFLLKRLIKWLYEIRQSILSGFAELQWNHSNMQWKLVWKSTSISEAWECVALKWHANQFDGIQIVFHLATAARISTEMLATARNTEQCVMFLLAITRKSVRNILEREEQREVKCWLIQCDNRVNRPRF